MVPSCGPCKPLSLLALEEMSFPLAMCSHRLCGSESRWGSWSLCSRSHHKLSALPTSHGIAVEEQPTSFPAVLTPGLRREQGAHLLMHRQFLGEPHLPREERWGGRLLSRIS